MLDDVRPEWRDPEYGHRLNQIRDWKAKSPQRPLLLIVGSSRIQMGIYPKAMDFADEPGSPVPYNLGYRGAPPSGSALHVLRMIDAGHIPGAVLFEFCPVALMAGGQPKILPDLWPGRLSYSDMSRIRKLGTSADGVPGPVGSRTEWARTLVPWTTCRFTLLSHWQPDWIPPNRLTNLKSERLDEFGFHSCPWGTPTPEQRRTSLQITRDIYAGLHSATQIDPVTDAVLKVLVARCQELGIKFAFIRIPESPAFRSWATPANVAAGNAYAEQITKKLGVPLFPALDSLEETDFIDGYHMLKPGAERYSRWLADTHIKPWLAGSR
ncbi:MAG: hypothetical protein K8U57_21055 [Planctomycetes bacterium]|nr:hypothetical protein [Planctomycetota bacterium]